MQPLINNILQWGRDRGLHETTDLKPQFTKLTEELGELAAGVARDDKDRITDAVGDMLVVLVNFGAVFGKKFTPEVAPIVEAEFLELCLQEAWDQIKARKGKTANGIFVKTSQNEEEKSHEA